MATCSCCTGWIHSRGLFAWKDFVGVRTLKESGMRKEGFSPAHRSRAKCSMVGVTMAGVQ